MKLFKYIRYTYFFLVGVLRFRVNKFNAAISFFERASKFGNFYENVQFYQYYGQALLALNHSEESFIWLSKAYEILNKEGWKAEGEEEYRLLSGTLTALKHLKTEFNLSVDDTLYEININRIK